MIGSIKEAGAWFVDGLIDGLGMIEDAARRRPLTRVMPDEGGYRVLDAAGRPVGEPFGVAQTAQGPAIAPEDMAQQFAGHDIDIVISSDELLLRDLDPMPAESRPYLGDIVRHQMDRMVPWKADEVLYTHRIEAGDAQDKLHVSVVATSRAIHGPLLRALRQLPVGNVRLVCHDVPGMGEIVIPVYASEPEATRQARLRRVAMMGLGAIALVFVVGTAWLTYQLGEDDAQVASLEQTLTEKRQSLAASGRGEMGDREINAMAARRRTTPFAVLALNRLANALPDDTYLLEFRIADGRVRITGISHSVAGLVPLIEATPGFAEATFFAPTQRLPDGKGDRFHLEARLVSAGAKS